MNTRTQAPAATLPSDNALLQAIEEELVDEPDDESEEFPDLDDTLDLLDSYLQRARDFLTAASYRPKRHRLLRYADLVAVDQYVRRASRLIADARHLLQRPRP